MKKILLLSIILLLSYHVSFAECESDGFSVWPNKENLLPNSKIVITAYGSMQGVILALNKKHPVYMQSKSHRIMMRLKNLYIGEYYLSQAILEPERKFEVGIEYELVIDSLNHYELMILRGPDFQKQGVRNQLKWTIGPKIKSQPVSWIKLPKEEKKVFEHYGSGQDVYVSFSFNCSSKTSFLIKTIIRNLKTNKRNIFYLPNLNNQVLVGRNMCNGAFVLDSGVEYEVIFSLIDANGQFSKQTNRIKFKAPIDPES